MRRLLCLTITIGILLTTFLTITKEAVWVKPIPVCTEKAVSPVMYCDYCHDDREY